MTINAAIYARVSSSVQEDNSSLEAQLERCREYCHTKGYTIVTDRQEIMSGVTVLARSKFNELLDLAAERQLDVIAVDIPDRLGRGDAIAKLELLTQLNGARIEYALPGRDTSTVEGMVLDGTDKLVSGIERINIRRRTMDGRRNSARAGRVIATSVRTFGYDYYRERDGRGRITVSQLVVREDEAQIVRDIFDWYVNEGLTLYKIAKRLFEMGIPTISEKDGQRKRRNNKAVEYHQWDACTVGYMLSNPTYKGEWRYGKLEIKYLDTPQGIKIRAKKRDPSQIVTVSVPAIVSKELWGAAQVLKAKNKARGHRPTRWHYLLRGRLRCAMCGYLFCGMTSAGVTRDFSYYRCRKTFSQYRKPDRCVCKPIPTRLVEPLVWSHLCELLLDDSRLFSGLEGKRAEAERSRKMICNVMAALEVQQQRARGKLDRLLDLYVSGELDKPNYLAKKSEFDRELERFDVDHRDLSAKLNEYAVLSPAQESELGQFRDQILNRLTSDVPFEEQAKLLELLKVECIYDDRTKEVTVTGVLGSSTLSITSRSIRRPSLWTRRDSSQRTAAA